MGRYTTFSAGWSHRESTGSTPKQPSTTTVCAISPTPTCSKVCASKPLRVRLVEVTPGADRRREEDFGDMTAKTERSCAVLADACGAAETRPDDPDGSRSAAPTSDFRAELT